MYKSIQKIPFFWNLLSFFTTFVSKYSIKKKTHSKRVFVIFLIFRKIQQSKSMMFHKICFVQFFCKIKWYFLKKFSYKYALIVYPKKIEEERNKFCLSGKKFLKTYIAVRVYGWKEREEKYFRTSGFLKLTVFPTHQF